MWAFLLLQLILFKFFAWVINVNQIKSPQSERIPLQWNVALTSNFLWEKFIYYFQTLVENTVDFKSGAIFAVDKPRR